MPGRAGRPPQQRALTQQSKTQTFKSRAGRSNLQSAKMVKVTPKLIAFDLDATLWIPEMYELSGPPFKPDPKSPKHVIDRTGERIKLMGASQAILAELTTDEKWRDTEVAYVSRTEYPQWAQSCLRLFKITDGVSMDDVAIYQEIYPGSKKTHFRQIHEESGIPYEAMLFFDNESWNITDVAPMGVCSIYTPMGMTQEVWEAGLKAFEEATAARRAGDMPRLAIKNAQPGASGYVNW